MYDPKSAQPSRADEVRDVSLSLSSVDIPQSRQSKLMIYR